MPVVSRADCTTYNSNIFKACKNNGLFGHYRGRLARLKGVMVGKLVRKYNNADETISANEDNTPSPTT